MKQPSRALTCLTALLRPAGALRLPGRLVLAGCLFLAACQNPLRGRLEALVTDYERIVAESAVYVHGGDGEDDNSGTRERPRKSIQSGIDLLAGLGIRGEVRVAEGTYVITAPLVVASGIAVCGGYDATDWDLRDIEGHQTVLQGSGVEHVVGFAAQAGESTLLEGFVIRAAPGDDAVAVSCTDCSPTIRFNRIDASVGTASSTGVFSVSGSPLIEANTIDAGQGSGYCWGIVSKASAAQARNNVIYCTAAAGALSAVVSYESFSAVIQNNTIHLGRSGDVGIYNLSGRIVVENNIIYAAAAGACGLRESDDAARPQRVNNNAIHGCTVVYKHGTGECGTVAEMEAYLDGVAVDASGNVDDDPAFVNASAQDYHLSAGSPAEVTDGGLNLSAWFTGDRDGDPRPPDPEPWSIGAYEGD